MCPAANGELALRSGKIEDEHGGQSVDAIHTKAVLPHCPSPLGACLCQPCAIHLSIPWNGEQEGKSRLPGCPLSLCARFRVATLMACEVHCRKAANLCCLPAATHRVSCLAVVWVGVCRLISSVVSREEEFGVDD